jgi:chromosome segregation ATPase
MNALMNIEKTTMVQPDSKVFENYLASKKDLARINENKQANNERVEILLERNDRLNVEIQNLKRELNKLKTEQVTDVIQVTDQQLLTTMKTLESQNKAEKKRNVLLTTKVEKFEALLDEVYETENKPEIDDQSLAKIKMLEKQYNSEKKSTMLLGLKVEQLQAAIDNQNTLKSSDVNSIQTINSQLESLLKRLKD